MNIVWEERFRTGHEVVDRQHQSLFAAVADFDEAVRDGAAPGRVDHMLEFLQEYVEKHFATEEYLMLRTAFPDLERHREEHRILTARVEHIQSLRFQDPGLVPAEGLAAFLAQWLRTHILQWDLALFEHVRSRPDGPQA